MLKIDVTVTTAQGTVTALTAEGDADAVLLTFLRWHGIDIAPLLVPVPDAPTPRARTGPGPVAVPPAAVPAAASTYRRRANGALARDEQSILLAELTRHGQIVREKNAEGYIVYRLCIAAAVSA